MDTQQKFESKAASLRTEADGLYQEAHAEKDEARANELIDRADKLVKESQTWDERAEKAGDLAQQRLADAERVFDGPEETTRVRRDGTSRPESLDVEASPEFIAERVELHSLALRGEKLPEEQYRVVARRLPHERLWMRALLTEGTDSFTAEKLVPLTADERKAFNEGMAAEREAMFRFMGVTQATSGASFVPTLVANRVVATMAHVGVMGDLSNGMTVTPLSPGERIDVPQLTDTHSKEAAGTAEGANVATTDLTTSKVSLNPYKRSFKLVMSEELLRANVVAFESRVVGLISQFFGRSMAKDLTNGDGTGRNSQGVATAAGPRQNITSGALVEQDVNDLYGALDVDYEMNTTCVYQAHKSILVRLMGMKAKAGDFRAFPLTADRRLPVLPGGLPIRYNPQLGADLTATNKLLVLGALEKYEVAYAPLRAVRAYDEDNDTHKLVFHMSWDGDFGDTRGFVRLDAK